MFNTFALQTRYLEEGRPDKAELLNAFIEMVVEQGGEDLGPEDPTHDADAIELPNTLAFLVEADWSEN
jgi:hypothetical protein